MSTQRRPAAIAAAVRETVRAHGWERHVLDLETLGYTVVEDVLGPEVRGRLVKELDRLGAEQATALDDGPERETQEVVLLAARGDRLLRELCLQPTTLGLIRYLLGTSARLSSLTGYRKPSGGAGLGVHSDTAYVPDPLPAHAHLANVNFCLTPYRREDGALTIVPGSHRWAHRPRDGAGETDAVPVEVEAGSAIVFHGNTWHGACPRTAPGHRLTISALYCRPYMAPQERYEDVLSADVVNDMGEDFARLVGRESPTGWRTLEEYRQVRGIRRDQASRLYSTRDAAG